MKYKRRIKTINVTDSDWRGILALLIVGGGFALLIAAMLLDKPWIASGLLPIMALVAQWYFKAKEDSKNGA